MHHLAIPTPLSTDKTIRALFMGFFLTFNERVQTKQDCSQYQPEQMFTSFGHIPLLEGVLANFENNKVVTKAKRSSIQLRKMSSNLK